MQSSPLVSIIVPVYNAESYLRQCLDSLLTLHYPHWEVILINDGSTDKSREICRQYTRQDNRIKIICQSNAGVSAARNRGIDEANGQFICFVDADDQVCPAYLTDLIADHPSGDKRGLIIHGIQQRNQAKETIKVITFPDRKLQGKDKYKAFTELNIYQYGSPFSKLYDRSLLNLHHIRFNPKVRHGEDLLFMTSYILISDYVCLGKSANYIYETYGTVSLSRSNRPYESERTCYEEMKGNLQELRQKSQMPYEEFNEMEAYISLFLIRALPALYRPPYTLPSKDRLSQLSTLKQEDLTLLKRWFHPRRSLDKIGKYLLIHRLLFVYECYMSIIFFCRYRLMR